MNRHARKKSIYFFFKKSIHCEFQALLFGPQIIVPVKEMNTLLIYYNYKNNIRILKSSD